MARFAALAELVRVQNS